MHPYRTRFAKEIVAEFYPPLARKKPRKERVVIFCPGQPGMPGGGTKLEFWAKKGYWAFTFRYRGTWESGGRFLRSSPERDVLDVLTGLSNPITETFSGKKLHIKDGAKVFLFGISFGGPAALLTSRDPRVTKTICFSPVVDWKDHIMHGETLDWTYRFTREAFGEVYRFSKKDWNKLKGGSFYNPVAREKQIDGRKVLIIHAKDDSVVRPGPVAKFAKQTGAKLLMLKRGGHVPSSWFTRPSFVKKIMVFLRER
jgi:pimeloyl-ACP methyl ester carboxylesterase